MAGPGLPDVDPADDEQLRVELAAPYRLDAAHVKPSVVMPSSRLAHVLSPAVVRRLAKRLDSLLRAEHGDDVAGRFIALEQLWLNDEVMRLVAFSPRLAGLAAEPSRRKGCGCRCEPVRRRRGLLPLGAVLPHRWAQ